MKVRDVGKYRVMEMIGEGSFGKVYKGVDRTNSEEVALKFITKRRSSNREERRQMENLKQEMEIMKKLKHPNIIALKDHFEIDNDFVVVLQFAGKDLSVVLENERKFKTEMVRQYATQILSALVYLNDNRIVHRDLKPQNILIKDGVVKICDFGFARKMSAMTMCLHSMKGTPLYIAPQIISQRPYNHKVDVWSMGIILFELAFGKPPFMAETYQKLVPRILHDKVRYPKDMDISLRDLIDGMLQKSPSSRYDWEQIINHPFMRTRAPLSEIPMQPNPIPNGRIQRNQDQFQENFPMDPKNIRSSVLALNKDRVEIAELRRYQEQIKQGKQTGKELKTDIVFYYQLISLFSGYSLGEMVSKEYLILAMRVLSRLISTVKLEGDCREDDITKKPDIVESIIAMVPIVEDDEVLAQAYSIIGYLLKNNFDSLNFDLRCSEKVIETAALTLLREKLERGVYSNILKVLGILAGQSLLTLKNSQQFFMTVAESKILSLLGKRLIPEKDVALVLFQCLVKFVHPSKGQSPSKTPQFLAALTQIKLDVASGLVSTPSNLSYFLKMAETLTQSELINFNSTIYQCVKVSQEFRKAFINSKCTPLFQKIPMFNIPMGYYMMKFEEALVLNIDIIKMQISKQAEIQYPIHRAFEINLLILTINNKADASIKLEQIRFYLKKIWEIFKLEDAKKQKSIETLEGWAFDCVPYKFDDLAVSAFMHLYSLDRTLEKQFVKSCEQLNIFENMVRVKGEQVNISFKYFNKLLPFLINHYKESKPSKKLTLNISQALLIYLSPDEISKLRTNQHKEVVLQYLQNCFLLIEEMVGKDDKKLQDFFIKTENINLHRLLLDQELIDDKLLPLSLKLLYRIIQKSPPYILDFVAVNGLAKLSKYYKQKFNTLTLEIVQIISHLARAKPDYYPNIAQSKIVQVIPKWLSTDNEQLIYKTLNLVGNLAKHSTFFFEQFGKYKVVAAIVNSIHYTKSFQKNVIYAIGNISYYNQQFKEDIRPLIPYLCRTLDTEDDHLLSNSISTLCNLLRHSDCYVKQLMSSGILTKILCILEKSKNVNITQFGLNFLLKAVNFPEMVSPHRESVKKTLRKIVCAMDSEIWKKIQKVQDKLLA